MTTYWESLSQNAKDTMRLLGNFGPTVNVANREVKGYTYAADGEGGKAYYDSNDLRNIAAGLSEEELSVLVQ